MKTNEDDLKFSIIQEDSFLLLMKIIIFKNDHQKLDQIESDREYEEKLSNIRKQTQVARTLSLTAIILSSVIGLFLKYIKIIFITQKNSFSP